MQLDFTDLSYDPKEYEFQSGDQTAKLMIRPCPESMSNMIMTRDGGLTLSGAEQCRIFKHCLTGWDIENKNGKPIKCTDDAKQKIFDFPHVAPGLVAFVLQKAQHFAIEKEEQEKKL